MHAKKGEKNYICLSQVPREILVKAGEFSVQLHKSVFLAKREEVSLSERALSGTTWRESVDANPTEHALIISELRHSVYVD
ncbi:hypothetical protein CYMTET_16272 [Cymbomonas tetramitiformis]|uniref:Uncharacterized protein n=1 Tax=Cymbomonas tetramitiformis TaxID=36881 RepID=A0AAE0GCJ4_9CHLO|nr:hypothetical protein CYMTET_16272 [Cymbomonas tetramitiformis]